MNERKQQRRNKTRLPRLVKSGPSKHLCLMYDKTDIYLVMGTNYILV
jgi:hypothetical protein